MFGNNNNPNSEQISKAIKAINKGDKWGFRIIFENFHAKIYNTSRKMNISHEDAEGIVQEVFLLLWEKRETIDHQLSINAYLLTISKRMIIKLIKKNILKSKYQNQKIEHRSQHSNNTEDYLIFTETEKNIHSGIDELPEARKQIFMLSRENGLTNDEISEKLNISKRTVENQLYRATKSIKDHLKKTIGK